MRGLINRILRHVSRETNVTGLEQRIQNRMWEESIDFIEANSHRSCDFYNSVEVMRREIFKKRPSDGMILEFGVNRGRSIQLFSKALTKTSDPRKIYGFDNFSGLTENWTGMGGHDGHRVRKRYFDLHGRPPQVGGNVELIIGDIEATLDPFLGQHKETPIAFIHIDTDTYTPCRLILEKCASNLVDGSIILFDQLLGYPGYRFHEFAALHEVLEKEQYQFIGFGIAQERSNLVKAAIKLQGIKSYPTS
jgi:hypothetical protein